MEKKYTICILGNTKGDIRNAYSWFAKTVYDGFSRLGHNVFGLDYKSHSLDQIENFLFDNNIDVLFTHLTMHEHHAKFRVMEMFDSLRSLNGTIIVHTLQDAREEPRYKGDISHAFDLALVSQYENINKFQNYWNVPVYYWPYSCMTYDEMGEYNPKLDFNMPVFPGNPGSHRDRADFLSKLQKKINMKIIRTGSKQDVRSQTKDFSVSNPCILSLSTRYDYNIKGYIDVRPLQYLGAGGILICRPHKGQEKIIPDELYFPIKNYSWESVDQVKEYWNEIKNSDLSDMRKETFNFLDRWNEEYKNRSKKIEIKTIAMVAIPASAKITIPIIKAGFVITSNALNFVIYFG